MLELYVNKVREILGGYICYAEVQMVEVCFYRGLPPKSAAQVVLNMSMARNPAISR